MTDPTAADTPADPTDFRSGFAALDQVKATFGIDHRHADLRQADMVRAIKQTILRLRIG